MNVEAAAEGLVVTELSLADWLRSAFDAERAPARPMFAAAPTRTEGVGRVVGGARVTFWWMLGICLLAIALL
jgi:hypothetical protein